MRGKLFEYISCIKFQYLSWDFLPIETRELLNITKQDYGIDAFSNDLKESIQVKYYKDSYVTFRALSTFYFLSSLLNLNKMNIVCNEECKLTNAYNCLSKFNIILNLMQFFCFAPEISQSVP